MCVNCPIGKAKKIIYLYTWNQNTAYGGRVAGHADSEEDAIDQGIVVTDCSVEIDTPETLRTNAIQTVEYFSNKIFNSNIAFHVNRAENIIAYLDSF